MTPWMLLVVMSLATYRLTRFTTRDTFPPVLWLRDRVAGGYRPWEESDGGRHRVAGEVDGVPHVLVQRASWSPYWLGELMTCPWCASGWISLGIVAGTAAWVGLPAPVLAWPAVWAAGALLASQRWS